MTYHNVLTAANELPLAEQVALAQALLGNVKAKMRVADTSEKKQADEASAEEKSYLSPLEGMSEQELLALAVAVVAPERQTEMRTLLEANRERTLAPDEEATMESFLEEVDQVALLKARALYTLKLQHPTGATS